MAKGKKEQDKPDIKPAQKPTTMLEPYYENGELKIKKTIV